MSIEYKQLPSTTDEFPPDVEMTTDDSDGEMSALEEMIRDCEFEGITLPDESGEDGKFHITIPGAAVGEFSECVYDIDGGQLEQLTEEWNDQALADAEAEK
jgi:hypothetical protein